MNPFSAISWIWKALRGQSVIFAGLFALALLGLSVIHWLKWGLTAVGIPWIGVLVLPVLFVGEIAKRENRWFPDLAMRRRWARILVFGSILLSFTLSYVRHHLFSRAESSVSQQSTDERRKVDGPSGK